MHSEGEEMMLLFRSNWEYNNYHERLGFKAVITAGKSRLFVQYFTK